VLNDTVGGREVVLIGETATGTVRAVERAGRRFAKAAQADRVLDSEGQAWRVDEEFLLGPRGARLARLPGHIAYWFAWDNYFGTQGTLYPEPSR
jgi:hypothetical protein